MACVDGEIFQSKKKKLQIQNTRICVDQGLSLDLFKGKFGISKKH